MAPRLGHAGAFWAAGGRGGLHLQRRFAHAKPAFDPAGTVTAANASSINDGAAALVIASEERAAALGAEKLIFLSDVNGVRRKKDDPKTLIHSLTESQARQMIHEGAIESGMIPKVEACLETLDHGVRKIHIIDGRLRHSLLLEIYTNKGVGTEMMREA
jgi:acetylglutamate kinase